MTNKLERFEVCPHCHENFTPNEYMPKVVDLMEEMIEILEVSSEAVQAYDIEVTWENITGLEEKVGNLFSRLASLWDGTDSKGYAEFCRTRRD